MADVPVLVVQDKARHRVGWVGDPVSVSMTPRHNQQPTGSITLLATDPKTNLLRVPGARIACEFRGEHMLGGRVMSHRTEGEGDAQTLTFEVADDWRLLSRLLGWQVPAAAITAQGSAEYRTITGPAETVVKTLVAENATRSGVPVIIAPDLGRGDTITIKARMDKLTDVLFPLVDHAGIGISVVGSPAGFTVDAYVPHLWPIKLSRAGRTLTDLQWSQQLPTVTRVVVGADGDGTARIYRQLVDTDLEAELGDVIEVFVDARDLKHTDADFEAQWLARAQAALAAGALTSGLSVKLAESRRFRYGPGGVHVGDRVPVAMDGTVTVTDVLRSATLTWSKDGTQVTPVVGERTDDPDTVLAAAVASAHRSIRQTQTRK